MTTPEQLDTRTIINEVTPLGPPIIPVRVVDFDMPFGSLVVFLFKIGIAAVPAAILLAIISAIVFAFFSGFVGALGAGL